MALIMGITSLNTAVQAYEQQVLVRPMVGGQPISASNPASPIQNIIFIISENHPFDNMLGTFPSLPNTPGDPPYALNPAAVCIPETTAATPCQHPYLADNLPTIQKTDQCHTSQCAIPAYDGGKMDGFYREDTNRSMAYYDGSALPQVWDLASYFGLDYNFFSSAMSYSEPNHLYSVAAASPATEDTRQVTPLNLAYPEIGTAMTNASVTWGYFQTNWNDAKDCTGNYNSQSGLFTKGGGDGFWEGEVQFRAVQNTAIECSSLGNMADFVNALSTNTLPQVSFLIPSPSESAHPGQGNWSSNQQYITSLINDIEQSSYWPHSVTYVTWDDYGGYYDGVVPDQLDQFGEGFRVPLIAVSPFSISGGLIGVCSGPQAPTVSCPNYNYFNNFTNVHGMTNQTDFSAFLSTIEYNWGIKPIATRDAEEPNLLYMLNFNQAPLPPLFFNSNYSLSAYPVSACITSGGCQKNTPFAATLQQLRPNSNFVSIVSSGTKIYSVYNATVPSWAESNAQAAAYAGNGDPDD